VVIIALCVAPPSRSLREAVGGLYDL